MEKHLESWLAQLDSFEAYVKGKVEMICPGHGAATDLSVIAATRGYLLDFADAVKTGDAAKAQQQMLKRYPDYKVRQFLTGFSIPAYFPQPTEPFPAN